MRLLDASALKTAVNHYSTWPFPGVKASWTVVELRNERSLVATYVASKDGAHRYETTTVTMEELVATPKPVEKVLERLLRIPPMVLLYMPGSEAYCWQPRLPFEEE